MFVVAECALHLAWKGRAEDRRVEAAGVLDTSGWIDHVDVEAFDGPHQLCHAAIPQATRHTVAHRLEGAAAAWRDRRATGGLGLDRRNPELLGGGDDERATGLQQARSLLV